MAAVASVSSAPGREASSPSTRPADSPAERHCKYGEIAVVRAVLRSVAGVAVVVMVVARVRGARPRRANRVRSRS
ncbi:hypothetical membrane protein [Rhodococcus opacus B4]|uniref:Hypothetical membrane protein n=1 Tax=Rhodococcus opacus (strain B4) TaxID=632772 RepID=C1B4B1_RHOOB|nr:hypothetical membrane protein [Rhodococcus opacus B4]